MKYFSVLSVVLSLIVLAVGCGGGNTVKASLGKEFTLAIGQTATFSESSLTTKFLDVTEDSRCPLGVQCIQAGRAVCSLEVKTNGLTQQVTLTEIGNTSDTTPYQFGGLSYKFKVTPYPEAGKQIAKSDYRLTLTVGYASP